MGSLGLANDNHAPQEAHRSGLSDDDQLAVDAQTLAYLALRGAVKPNDLSLHEVQELCITILRHLRREEARGERHSPSSQS